MPGNPSVRCPCCDHALYRADVVAPGVPVLSKDSPEVLHDAKGDFMKCPHCAKRIGLRRVPAVPRGLGFELSPDQDCGEPPN